MGDKQRIKIENNFRQAEENLALLPKLKSEDKKVTLKKVDSIIGTLDNDIQRFSMNEYGRFPEKCEAFDNRLNELTENFQKITSNEGGMSQMDDEENYAEEELTEEQIIEMNLKFRQGKNRTIALLHTKNRIRDEIELIDDEVSLQKEKLLNANEKIKSTQSVFNQTKNLIAYFAKSVFDDLLVKILIGLIILVVIGILVMAIAIKIKTNSLEEDENKPSKLQDQTGNYDELDEILFLNFGTNKKVKYQDIQASKNKSKTKAGDGTANNAAKKEKDDDSD